MALKVKNTSYDVKAERERIESIINRIHESKWGEVYIPIASTAYHNNGTHIFDTALVLDVAREAEQNGFFAYYYKPSNAYSRWMDIKISVRPLSGASICRI